MNYILNNYLKLFHNIKNVESMTVRFSQMIRFVVENYGFGLRIDFKKLKEERGVDFLTFSNGVKTCKKYYEKIKKKEYNPSELTEEDKRKIISTYTVLIDHISKELTRKNTIKKDILFVCLDKYDSKNNIAVVDLPYFSIKNGEFIGKLKRITLNLNEPLHKIKKKLIENGFKPELTEDDIFDLINGFKSLKTVGVRAPRRKKLI